MKNILIFLPGLGANETLFSKQIAYFQQLYHTQAITLPLEETREQIAASLLHRLPLSFVHADSTRQSQIETLRSEQRGPSSSEKDDKEDQDAQNLAANGTTQPTPRFILVGHSMGGWIAQAIAAAHPERIEKLILLNTWAQTSLRIKTLIQKILHTIEKGHFEEIQRLYLSLLIHPSRLQDESLLKTLSAMLSGMSPNMLLSQLKAILSDETSPHLLSRITCPTLIVHAEQDQLFSMEDHEEIAQQIPTSTLVAIKECGHCSPIEKPEEVTGLISHFLEKYPAHG